MRENRILPVPGLLNWHSGELRWAMAWGPALAVALGSIYIFMARQEIKPLRMLGLSVFGCMTGLLTLQSHNRFDMPHAGPSIIFSLCFFAITIAGKNRKFLIAQNAVTYLSLAVIAVATYMVASPILKFAPIIACFSSPAECMNSHKGQTECSDWIKANASPTEYVFVGNTRHDKIFINDASLYFILNRPVPVKWNEMHPGVVTTEPVQKEIIEQLNAKRVRFIVLVDIADSTENNLSGISSGVHLLDNFIRDNYDAVFASGKYEVRRRVTGF